MFVFLVFHDRNIDQKFAFATSQKNKVHDSFHVLAVYVDC